MNADLIHEARGWIADGPFDTGAKLIQKLADALEAATAPEPADRCRITVGNPRGGAPRRCTRARGHAEQCKFTPEPAALSDEPTDAELLGIARKAQDEASDETYFGPILRAVFEAGRKHESGER